MSRKRAKPPRGGSSGTPPTMEVNLEELAAIVEPAGLVDAYKRHDWLLTAVMKRLREEFAKLDVEINEEKSGSVEKRVGYAVT